MIRKRSLIIILTMTIPFLFINCFFNESPIIDSLYVLEEYDLAVDDTLHVICSAHDPDGDRLTYTWTCSQGGTIIVSNKDTATLIANDTLLQVECSINDMSGGTASENLQFSLTWDSAPIIDSLYVMEEPGLANIGDQLHLVCEAHHPKGSTLEYIWSTDSGILTENEDQATLQVSEYAAIEVSCTVKDSYTSSTVRSFSFDIPAEIHIDGVLKAGHSQSDSLLGNIPFGFEGINSLWESAIKTSQDGTFSFTLEKPLTDLTFQTIGYYVNYSEFAYEKSIPINDIKKKNVNDNLYELDIFLDIPSTNNFYEYMPLAVGNSWTFSSSYGSYDDARSDITAGTEIWEISDMNETGDTLILDVSFDGIEYITPYSGSEGDTTWGEEHHLRRQYKLYKLNQFIFYDKTLFSQGSHLRLPVAESIFKNGLQHKYEDMVDSLEYERPILTNPESLNPQLEMRSSYYKMESGIGPKSIRLDFYENNGSTLTFKSYKPSD